VRKLQEATRYEEALDAASSFIDTFGETTLGKLNKDLLKKLEAEMKEFEANRDKILAQRVPEPSPAEKVEKLLALLVKRSGYPGAPVSYSAEWDYPLIDARNVEEAMFHTNALVAQGYIDKLSADTVIVTHSGWGRSRARAVGSAAPLPEPPVVEPDRAKEWDAFVSHASEDKERVVEPLVRALEARGLRVWYDRTTLAVGDSLRRSIDAGLARSSFGIVVLSPAFFAKPWPQWELDGLVQREMGERKVILPVWHRVGHAEVAQHSPSLADRVAGSTSQGIETLADRLLEAMRGGPRIASRERPPVPSMSKGEQISESERELLIAALESNGELIVFSTQQTGEFVAVGKRTFIDDHDPAVRARYLEALETLRERGLVRHEGGQLFRLTGSGFDLARQLAGRE
jgi:hypothetical protein